MSRWLVLTLVFAHILVTVVACLATILLYFLLRQKQRQYAAATRQAKALVEKYEKRKTDRRELSTQLDKEAWIQRQKMKSLQEQVEKLEKNIQSVQREKEELELRLKQVTDARDKLLQVVLFPFAGMCVLIWKLQGFQSTK